MGCLKAVKRPFVWAAANSSLMMTVLVSPAVHLHPDSLSPSPVSHLLSRHPPPPQQKDAK
jgi:hypothetical protein